MIYLFITRRQNYIDILGFLAAGGVHSRHNHSFEVLRLVSYSTHLKWNHCPQRSHKTMLSYSSGSLHSHKVAIVTLLCCLVTFSTCLGEVGQFSILKTGEKMATYTIAIQSLHVYVTYIIII